MITIGIDIDDVIVQTNKKALEIIDREKLPKVDYYEKLPNLNDFISKYFEEIVKKAELFSNCKETIDELKIIGYRIVFISSRAYQKGADTEEDTINYLKDKKIFYDKVLLRKSNKLDACIQEKVDYFIDDKEKVLDTLNKVNIKCIKMTSIEKNTSKYHIVKSWKDILNYFLKKNAIFEIKEMI